MLVCHQNDLLRLIHNVELDHFGFIGNQMVMKFLQINVHNGDAVDFSCAVALHQGKIVGPSVTFGSCTKDGSRPLIFRYAVQPGEIVELRQALGL